MKYENIFTATEARFLSNAPTENRPSGSRLPPDPTIASFIFLATEVATVRILFQFFLIARTCLSSSLTDLGYGIIRRFYTAGKKQSKFKIDLFL
jgi:hypothetical protein